MSLTPFTQWRFPKVGCHDFDGHLVSLRINKGMLGYSGPADPTKIVTLDPLFQGAIFDIGELELAKHDVDADPVVPKIVIKLSDYFAFTGVSDSVPVSYNLGTSYSSLLEEIFTPDDGSIIYELWLDQYDNTGTLIEVWFVGDIDPRTIPKKYVYFHNEFTNTAQRLAEYDLTANFAAERFTAKTVAGVPQGTIQNFLTDLASGGYYSDTGVDVFVGNAITKLDNPLKITGSLNEVRLVTNVLSCAGYTWTNTETAPNGVNVVSLDKLCKLIAKFGNFHDSGSGIDWAEPVDLYGQYFRTTANGTSLSSNFDALWNLSKISDIKGSPITWDDIFVVANFLFGFSIPKSTETDTPQNKWPNSISPTASVMTLLRWISEQTVTYVAYAIDTSGNVDIRLRPRRPVSPIDFATNFPFLAANITESGESPKKVLQSSLIVQCNADDVKVMCGPNESDAITITTPWRCHRYGSPIGSTGNTQWSFPNGSTTPFIGLTAFLPPSFLELWWDKSITDITLQGLATTCEKKANDNYYGGSAGDILSISFLGVSSAGFTVGEVVFIFGGTGGTATISSIDGSGHATAVTLTNSGYGYTDINATAYTDDKSRHVGLILTLGDGQPTDRGWIGSTMLLWKNEDPTFVVIPQNEHNSPHQLFSSEAGYYAVAAIAPNGVSVAGEQANGYFNPQYAYAQIYYQELIGNRIVIVQKYAGCRDVNGFIQPLCPGIQMSTFIRGAVRDFQAHEVKISVLQNTAEITWVEVLDYNNLLQTVTVLEDAGSQSSTSGSSSSSTGTNGGLSGNFLKNFPAIPSDNAIIPVTAAIPALNPFGAIVFGETLITDAGVVALEQSALYVRCSTNTTTGITLPTPIGNGHTLFVLNDTGADFLTGDTLVPNGVIWGVMYTGSTTSFDSTLPVGWILLTRTA